MPCIRFRNTNRLLFLLGMLLFSAGSPLATSFDDSKIGHIGYPGWFTKSPFYDLKEELDKTRIDNKQGLMVFFTTQGCSYCEQFIRNSLGNAQIAATVQKYFNAIGMEIFDDTEMTDPHGVMMPIKQFAKQEGVGFSPTLLFYDTNGKRILRAVGYQSPERFNMILAYLSGRHYQQMSLHDYLAHESGNTIQPVSKSKLNDDPLFGKPPHLLDRSRIAASQPLLILFEESGCAACDEFHREVLAVREVRERLRQFEVVRLDARDDKSTLIAPDGKRMSPASLFRQLDFSRAPALAFFDERGKVVLQTDALVLRQRMYNSLGFVLERAYEQGWSFQRYARTKSLERLQQRARDGQQ